MKATTLRCWILLAGLGLAMSGAQVTRGQPSPPDESRAYLPIQLRAATPEAEATALPTREPTQPPSPSASAAPSSTPLPLPTRSSPEPTSPSGTPGTMLPPSPEPTPTGSAGHIRVDHRSVAGFEHIPEAWLVAAAGLRMAYMDASVGNNISEGLDCLTFESMEAAPSRCRRLEHPAPEFDVAVELLAWSRPGGYPRDDWRYEPWPAGGDCGGWQGKVGCFVRHFEPRVTELDVLSFQHSYLDVMPGSNIAEPEGGFFDPSLDAGSAAALERFEAAHPDRTIIWWTTSLARGIGSPESTAFNEGMRRHAAERGKVLFDVADILSHDPDGEPCYDNRDGIAYSNGNRGEDHPDDGLDLPAICQHYTTEVEGGHLGSVSAGKIRVAKAFWVLMARIAGWDGR